MFRPEIFFGLLVWILAHLYSTLFTVTFALNGFAWLFDFITRVDLNESFVNMFNFFWTSFLYLPPFFSVWFFFCWFGSNPYSQRLLLAFITLLLVGYSFESFDTLTISYHSDCFDFDNSAVNLLLSNNLNKYHPFIFYMSVAIGSRLMVKGVLNYFNALLFTTNDVTLYHTSDLRCALILNLTSLFMGSWWALQEGTWGGWWNWDASEVLGLLVSMGALLSIHTTCSSVTITQLHNRLSLTGLATLLSYAFIQLNFDLVSHNFGSKFFFFFNNNLFLLELVLFSIIKVFSSLVNVYTVQSQILPLFSSRRKARGFIVEDWWPVIVFYFVLAGLLGSSFLPLLNYFIWSYFGLNSFNFHTFRPLLVLVVTFILLSLFVRKSSSFSSLWWVVSIHPIASLLSQTSAKGTLSRVLHTTLMLMAINNLNSYDCSFIQWYNFTNFQEPCLSQSPIINKQVSFVCNNFWVETSALSTTSYYCDTLSWNIFYGSNTPSLQTFFLHYSAASFYNLYTLSTGWLNSTLFIELNYLNNLVEAWTTLTLGVVYCGAVRRGFIRVKY